jgi:hypothetical protein
MGAEKYQKIHDRLIERARSRTLLVYFERHHIQPKSLGGSDEPSNLVRLTYREHFLVHWLLTKLVPVGRDRQKMVGALFAVTMPARSFHQDQARPVAGWQIEIAKRLLKDECAKRERLRRLREIQERAKANEIASDRLARIEANKQLTAEWLSENAARPLQVGMMRASSQSRSAADVNRDRARQAARH